MSDDTDFGTASTLPMSVTIPGYRFRRQAGSDSLGLWFDVIQESLGRKLTLKVLKPQYEHHEAARREFLAEMDRLAALDHAQLPRVIDTIREGTLALVTERVGGKTAEVLLGSGKSIGEAEALKIARGVSRALDHLIGEGFAHKNVTPALIAIREDGEIRLATFRNVITLDELVGLRGRLAQDANYVAPEQLVGDDPIDGKTHVYHVGALLFHLLAGRPPHKGASAKDVARAHLKEDFPALKRVRPFLKQGVYDLVAACTARNPELRPELDKTASALDALLAGKDPGLSGDKSAGDIVAPRSRRRRRRY